MHPKGNVVTIRLSQTQTKTGTQNNTNIPFQLPQKLRSYRQLLQINLVNRKVPLR
jgi:hypothetical protein